MSESGIQAESGLSGKVDRMRQSARVNEQAEQRITVRAEQRSEDLPTTRVRTPRLIDVWRQHQKPVLSWVAATVLLSGFLSPLAASEEEHTEKPVQSNGGGPGGVGPGTTPPIEAGGLEAAEAGHGAKKSTKKKKSAPRPASHATEEVVVSSESKEPAGKELVPLPPPDPVAAEQILEIALLEPTVGPLQQGALQTFRYEIRNSSKDVVVLKELRTTNAEDMPLSLTLSGYGTLTYAEKSDAYLYDSMVQQSTPKVFEHGVMLPGDSRRVELPVRLLLEKQTLLLRFQMMTMDEFRRAAFVPVESSDRINTFQHLQTLPPDYMKPQSVPLGPIHDKPVILWTELLGKPLLLLEQRSSRTIPLKPLPLSLDDARKVANLDGPGTWWSWAQGWVVNGPSYAMLVNRQGGRMLPLVDPQVFRDIDSGLNKIRVKITPTSQLLKTRFATREGDGIYTFGDFIEVPRERLWELFDLARIDHLAVTRETYLFDAYYYVLTPLP